MEPFTLSCLMAGKVLMPLEADKAFHLQKAPTTIGFK
jgi:hypothetical protein